MVNVYAGMKYLETEGHMTTTLMSAMDLRNEAPGIGRATQSSFVMISGSGPGFFGVSFGAEGAGPASAVSTGPKATRTALMHHKM